MELFFRNIHSRNFEILLPGDAVETTAVVRSSAVSEVVAVNEATAAVVMVVVMVVVLRIVVVVEMVDVVANRDEVHTTFGKGRDKDKRSNQSNFRKITIVVEKEEQIDPPRNHTTSRE